ncbi:hypothetical protein L2E82_12864 [Cichorium intybus]|uniref:Uncharacterized protein n=1 Tax=Cichorium intybus TaxID=13427 RepID=A0ACB9GHE0_CICIN|nr:hypothetical protein L2E82_12864 [Cichorium intybus]
MMNDHHLIQGGNVGKYSNTLKDRFLVDEENLNPSPFPFSFPQTRVFRYLLWNFDPLMAHNLKFYASDEYELAVSKSIQNLLDSLQNPNPALSGFTSTFLELMQAKTNPLLESIWVFSGLTFLIKNPPKDDILDQVLDLKGLFQSITANSASCSSSTCIALIAPVIYKLCTLAVDSKSKEVDSKRGKKARREIKSFLDVILGYFNVCSDGSNGDEDSALVRPLVDIVSIWVHGEATGNQLKQFFPLLSDEIINSVAEETDGAIGLLAGAVLLEAFLLKLCLKFSEGSSRKEAQNELRTWAVSSITGFHNFYFFYMLVKMLLEPNLTVSSLLSSEDESLLRNLLYDAVILPDYSFLHLDKVGHLPINHIKTNILARIMVTHEAVELFRKNNDHSKAISYTNAFSGSHLPTLITKLVTNELGNQGKTSQPNGSSPMAFLKWMLDLESQGLSFSDGFMSKYRERLVLYTSKSDVGQPSGKTDQDLLFFIDNKGNDEDEDEKIDDSMNDVFVAAAHAMRSGTNGNGKKRKETSVEKKKDGVKFQRHHSGPRSGEKTRSIGNDDSGSGSEVEDPDSDSDSDE